MPANSDYYDALARDYHLLYRDWESTVEREGLLLRHWFAERDVTTVLDASCGTGTQSIALALIGYRVLAADPSSGMIEKAKLNAEAANVAKQINFLQAGFVDLARMIDAQDDLDAIVTKGDAFPHLIDDLDIEETLGGFYRLLRPGGTILIGMKDFEPLIQERPRFMPGRVHEPEDNEGNQIIVFEVWDWDDGPPLILTINHFIVTGDGENYETARYPIKMRALTADEVQVVLLEAGFVDIQAIYDRSELVMIATKPR